MIFDVGKYQKGNYAMPDRDNKEIDKESEEYYLQLAQAVYSEFCRGATHISYDYYSSVQKYREYALGLQDKAMYEDAFYGSENKNNTLENFDHQNSRNARRKAYANLNFQIQSPMPRVMDTVVNKLVSLVDRVSVDATDQYSGAERENMKWGTYVDGKYRKELDSLKALMVLPQQEQGYTPKSVEELNLFEAEGGFKLTYEEVMERLLKFSFENSKWEENTVERVMADLVTLGFAVVEDVYDKHSGLVKVNYVDAQYAGVQYTREDGNYDPDFGFYTKMVKMTDLKKRGIDEKKLHSMAKLYSGHFNNPSIEDWNNQNKTGSLWEKNGADRWTIPVFVVKFIDVETKQEKEYTNRQGKTRTKEIQKGEKVKKTDKIIETRIKVAKEVHWIISSDVVYEYGKCEFQARDGFRDPVLPIHMVQVSGRPIVPRLIPALDQYMNAWMRLQQGISMAAMNGFAINMDAVSNLSLGGKKLDPREVLRLWRQTGTLFFKPTDVRGMPNQGMVTRPIEQLPGGAGMVIAESVQVMDIAMKQIEELTGINPVTMGATPQQDQGKALTEYALVGTNDILKGVLKKANIIKSNVARAMCLRLQHVIEADERAYKAHVDVVGESALKAVKIANGHDVKYGIRTQARPTQEEVQAINDMLSLSLKNGRDGKVGITEADYIRFKSMMASGASLKRVALLLDFANQKAQREAEAKESRMLQQSQQGAIQQAQMNAQAEQRKIAMESQAKISEEQTKGINDVVVKAFEKGDVSAEQALMIIRGRMELPQEQTSVVQQQSVGEREREPIPAGMDGV